MNVYANSFALQRMGVDQDGVDRLGCTDDECKCEEFVRNRNDSADNTCQRALCGHIGEDHVRAASLLKRGRVIAAVVVRSPRH